MKDENQEAQTDPTGIPPKRKRGRLVNHTFCIQVRRLMYHNGWMGKRNQDAQQIWQKRL